MDARRWLKIIVQMFQIWWRPGHYEAFRHSQQHSVTYNLRIPTHSNCIGHRLRCLLWTRRFISHGSYILICNNIRELLSVLFLSSKYNTKLTDLALLIFKLHLNEIKKDLPIVCFLDNIGCFLFRKRERLSDNIQ